LSPGEYVGCTFTNTAQPATLIITKTVVGEAPDTDWSFAGSGEIGDFDLPGSGGSQVFDDLPAGTYSITETAKIGYDVAVLCSDGSSGVQTVTITLLPGEIAGCEFTNTAAAQPVAALIITKTVVGLAPATSWSFSGSGEIGDFDFPGTGGEIAFTTLPPGTYTVTETVKAGYGVAVVCSDGSSGEEAVTVTLSAGETVGCVFTNTDELRKNYLPAVER
jgi:hypothetical protein